MRIGVDLRPLQEGLCGVAEYTRNISSHLIRQDKKNEYIFFSNSLKKNTSLLSEQSTNAHKAEFHIPSKILNASIYFFNRPYIDRLIARDIEKKIDLFFAPNAGFLSLSPSVKKVITMHDITSEIYPDFLSKKSLWWHRFVNPKRLCRSFDHIIAVSQNTKNDIVSTYGIAGSRISVIPLGIDQSFLGEEMD